jgi:alpha-glucosidase
VLGNHDRPRVASRVGVDQARVAAMLLLTLRGTPTLYYGDEIGMHQVPIPPEQVRDPLERNVPGLGLGRDGCRTPMQWDSTGGAGFSQVRPWLPLAEDFMHENVSNLDADKASILALYKALIALRGRHEALALGSYEPIAAKDNLLIYRRAIEGSSAIVVLNLGADPVSLSSDAIGLEGGRILLSSLMDRWEEKLSGSLDLRGHEGVIASASFEPAQGLTANL